MSPEQITLLFMRRFNCASNRIIKIATLTPDCSHSRIPGLLAFRSGMVTSWKLSPVAPYIHPFTFMLLGKRCKSVSPLADIEAIYPVTSAIETFRQGFSNFPHFNDNWRGLDADMAGGERYYFSLYFNLGRAFLHKFCGIRLPYFLPPAIDTIFQSLK